MTRALCACLLLPFITAAALAQSESAIIEQLMTAKDRAALDSSISMAKDLGLPQQMFIEAQLNFALGHEDLLLLRQILPEAQSCLKDFSPGKSGLQLVSEDQLRGMISYGQSLIALEEKDEAEFQKLITQAIWLFPDQATAFGRAISKHQRLQRLSRQALDMTQPLPTSTGKKRSLGDLIGGGSALVLIFWSPKAPKSAEYWQSYSAHMAAFQKSGISAVGVCLSELKKEAAPADDSGKKSELLILDTELRLARSLEVSGTPTAVMLSAQGKVIFHGHPKDRGFWNKAKALVPGLVMPLSE
jgi:peroxiredoxin